MRQGRTQALACGLGIFSIAIGVAELVAPRWIARRAGARVSPNMIRAFGVREIATGVGRLMAAKRAPWLWGRVAGDALDVATVGAGLVTRGRPLRTLASVAMLLGIAYVDMKVAEKAPPARKLEKRSLRDYTGRSGFPRSAAEMRGVALKPSTPMKRPQGPATAMAGSPAQPLMQAGEPIGSSLP